MTDVNKMTIYCTRCGRMYDPEKPHDCGVEFGEDEIEIWPEPVLVPAASAPEEGP